MESSLMQTPSSTFLRLDQTRGLEDDEVRQLVYKHVIMPPRDDESLTCSSTRPFMAVGGMPESARLAPT